MRSTSQTTNLLTGLDTQCTLLLVVGSPHLAQTLIDRIKTKQIFDQTLLVLTLSLSDLPFGRRVAFSFSAVALNHWVGDNA